MVWHWFFLPIVNKVSRTAIIMRPPCRPRCWYFTRCGPPAGMRTLTYDQQVRATFFLSPALQKENHQGRNSHRPQLLMTYIWPATDDTGDSVFAFVHMIHDKLFFFPRWQRSKHTFSCPVATCSLFGTIITALLYAPNEYNMLRQSHQFKGCWIFHCICVMQNARLCPEQYAFMPVNACLCTICVCVAVWRQLRWWWLPGELKLMSVIRSKQRAKQGQLIQARRAELLVCSARHGWGRRDGGLRCNHRQTPQLFPHTADVHWGKALWAWHRHASANRPLGQPGPNTSWQPPGSVQITPSSLFSSRAKGRPSPGAPALHTKGTRAELHSRTTICERDRGT